MSQNTTFLDKHDHFTVAQYLKKHEKVDQFEIKLLACYWSNNTPIFKCFPKKFGSFSLQYLEDKKKNPSSIMSYCLKSWHVRFWAIWTHTFYPQLGSYFGSIMATSELFCVKNNRYCAFPWKHASASQPRPCLPWDRTFRLVSGSVHILHCRRALSHMHMSHLFSSVLQMHFVSV